MTEPVIPHINWKDFSVTKEVCTGRLDKFDIQLITRWGQRRRTEQPWENYETPSILGAVMAINKTFYEHLGGYDDQLRVWGGEQFDISFKVWMCGQGRVLAVPCSIAGHNFKGGGKHPFYRFTADEYYNRNLGRIAKTFFDPVHWEKFYELRLKGKNIDLGDLTKQFEMKTSLGCKSFQWYIENVFPEFPIELEIEFDEKYAWGQVIALPDTKIP